MKKKYSSQPSPSNLGDKQNIILDSIADGVFTVDQNRRITSFNRAAQEITGVSVQEAMGQLCKDVLKADICEKNCCLRATMKTGKPIVNKKINIINAEGKRIPVTISTALLRAKDGTLLGAVETFRDISIEEDLRKVIKAKYSFADIISKNHKILQLFDILPDIAGSTSTVLIEGESGTGKELFARAVHNLSPRKKQAFVAVNCGALPDTLLESELFGYKAGAFTGAHKDKLGRFAIAKGGTLFLDEIGQVSPALQVRLLRVLQERVYEPLGSTRSESADVRILAATNSDLTEETRQGRFREDLYYRINVVRVELPPLRRRIEDIPLLAGQFISRFNNLQNKQITGIAPEALSLLMAHDWPGNVRELENVIERAFVLCREGEIGINHLPDQLTTRGLQNAQSMEIRAARDLLDARTIQAALEETGYHRLAAARLLGIHKTTLFRKIRKLGIVLPERK